MEKHCDHLWKSEISLRLRLRDSVSCCPSPTSTETGSSSLLSIAMACKISEKSINSPARTRAWRRAGSGGIPVVEEAGAAAASWACQD